MSKLRKKNPIKEIAEELDVFDTMFSTLLELLEEKGLFRKENLKRECNRR